MPFSYLVSSRDAVDLDTPRPRLTTGKNIVISLIATSLFLRPGQFGYLWRLLLAQQLSLRPHSVTLSDRTTVRQRPGTASGVIFATIEDETGTARIIIWLRAFDAHCKQVM